MDQKITEGCEALRDGRSVFFRELVNPPRDRLKLRNAQHTAGWELLAEQFGGSLPEVSYQEHGKPYFRNGPNFNLSHSGALVLLVISETESVGCDVEDCTRVVRNQSRILEKISKNFPARNDRALSFFEHWVCSEAQYKAGGVGELVMLPAPEGYVAAACFRDELNGG